MKLFVGLAIFVWLLCGLVGAWMLAGGGQLHWKTVAKGPISLVKALNESPVTAPVT